jgi:hypothetical protein
MEAEMTAHNPIGRCCSRPRFNVLGEIDERTWSDELASVLGQLKRTVHRLVMSRRSDQVEPPWYAEARDKVQGE